MTYVQLGQLCCFGLQFLFTTRYSHNHSAKNEYRSPQLQITDDNTVYSFSQLLLWKCTLVAYNFYTLCFLHKAYNKRHIANTQQCKY